jgi:hypothetical protein
MPPLTWSKPAAFPGFASKDFGELGSLSERSEFEQVPKVCEQNRRKYTVCDGSGGMPAAPPAFDQQHFMGPIGGQAG